MLIIEIQRNSQIGRFARGTVYARIVKAPENIPAAPTPATARPIINAFDVGAAPHTTDPTSKIMIADR